MFPFQARKCTEHEQQQLKQEQQEDHHRHLQQQYHQQQQQQQQNDEIKLSNIGDGREPRTDTNTGAGAGAGASPFTSDRGPSSPDDDDDDDNTNRNDIKTRITSHLQEQRKLRKLRKQREQQEPQQEPQPARQQERQQGRTSIYQPRIDRYTCVGKYLAYTDRTENYFQNINLADVLSEKKLKTIIEQKIEKHRSDDSICNGYMSKIKTLQSFNQMTRADAVKQFINEYEDIDYDDNIHNDNSTIYDNCRSDEDINKVIHNQLTETLDSDVLIFSSPSSRVVARYPFDAIDTIDTDVKQEEMMFKKSLVCYGSTDVDCLIIKNVKTCIESIAAVVPKTKGYSHCTVSKHNIRIGKKLFDFGRFSLNFIKTEKTSISVQVQEMYSTMLLRHKIAREYRQYKAEMDNKSKPKVTVTDIIQESIKFTKLVQANTYTILTNTKMNLQWFATVVQDDDFINRVCTFTTKIVYNIPTIISITTTYWFKILSKNDDNNNDDNDSNNTGGSSSGSNFPRRR